MIISQSRQSKHADKRAELNYEVNVRTYRVISKIDNALAQISERINKIKIVVARQKSMMLVGYCASFSRPREINWARGALLRNCSASYIVSTALAFALWLPVPCKASDSVPSPALTISQIRLGEKLSQAADQGDLAAVKSLLAQGAPPDEVDPNYTPPLLMAAISSSVKPGPYVQIGELLLNHGANIDAYAGGVNAVDKSVSLQSIPFLQMLLNHKPNLDSFDALSRTPLMEAVIDGPAGVSLTCVRLLVQHGANINTTSPTGASALDLAVKTDITTTAEGLSTEAPQIVNYLLSHGADISKRDAHKRTPLIIAAENLALAHINQIAPGTPPPIPLEAIGELIAHGSDPNAQDDQDRSALMIVLDKSRHGQLRAGVDQIASTLMPPSLDPDLKDINGRCLLDYAIDAPANQISSNHWYCAARTLTLPIKPATQY